jgi:hypothetical protein
MDKIEEMKIFYVEEDLLENPNPLSNISALIQYEEAFLKSYNILDISRKLNIFSVCIVMVIGLVGHFLTILVFSQKRFRTNPSNVL